MPDSHLTLSQLQECIRQTLCDAFDTPVWIAAEIGELKVNARSGHCYMQLVEKGGRNGVPKAQASAVIWASQYGMLSSYFRGATGRSLEIGMNVLLNVTVTYHELYGLALRVTDIDPLYTMGDLERQRQQTIAQLREDGVFDLNRELEFPAVPLRIAVVSSPQAAGYQDFMKELGTSPYAFKTTLFEAVMQGHGAEASIIGALERIADAMEDFDVTVIIRGGGSQSDLSFLNSYLLGFHVAQFPLPVVTGLGHDKDQSVVDMVAAISLKTPTAVAAFLVDRVADFDGRLLALGDAVRNIAARNMLQHRREIDMIGALLRERASGISSRLTWRMDALQEKIKSTAVRTLTEQHTVLASLPGTLKALASQTMASAARELMQAERLTAAVDPRNILARGFAIVRSRGTAVKNASNLNPGDKLDITLYDGCISAEVTETTNPTNNKTNHEERR